MLELIFGNHLRDFGDAIVKAVRHAKDHDEPSCHIPETSCPPRCVETIRLAFGRGATPKVTLLVRNTGRESRNFQFATTPLAGVDVGAATIEVAPANADIAPGDTQLVQLTIKNSEALTAAQDYRAEFLFTGTWEQCVRILCKISPEATDTCLLTQGHEGIKKIALSYSSKAELEWTIDRGMVPEGTLTLRNVGDQEKSFSFEPSSLAGVGAGAARLEMDATELSLEPGQSGSVQLRLYNSDTLSPSQRYRAEVTVRGYEDQRVAVRCFVRPDPVEHVDVEQGEFPTRIKGHKWYHHFQCTVDCAVPKPDKDTK